MLFKGATGGMSPSALKMTEPLIEKYRPLYLSDVVGNSEAIQQLKSMCEVGSIPHLLFAGPPGCGKTSTALCIVRQILRTAQTEPQIAGTQLSDFVLELNASDERGIDIVRNKIKEFAGKKVSLTGGGGGGAHFPFPKVVVLDEADSMTTTAQQALRVIISDHSNETRFILACNDSTKIIEPIQSRLSIVRFKKLKDEEIASRLVYVAAAQNIEADDQGIQALIYSANGDMRYALNNMQAVAAGAGSVTYDAVFKICDVPRPERIQQILTNCLQGEIDSACDLIDTMWTEGYGSFDILNALYRSLMFDESIKEVKKLDYLQIIGKAKVRVLAGLNTKVQLYCFIANMCELGVKQMD